MQGHPHWSIQETLRLCQNHWDLGVVGLDLCTWQPEDSRVGRFIISHARPPDLEHSGDYEADHWDIGLVRLDLCTCQTENSTQLVGLL
ncbi:hypothetical protein J6590_073485 [Homalodisca vitripennis]|nr:hypothetical protein J6590_073485 [Homalodisca vitripennis]